MKTCAQCSSRFEITERDIAFYERINVNPPQLCPGCRSQQRMAFRNEKTLYKRKCDLCSKGMITIFSNDKPFPVYCQDCYWGDQWDASSYSVTYDPDVPFFQQYQELLRKTPRLAIINKQSQNSDYCNYSFANKNCYLTFGNHYEENCMYGRYSTKNNYCLDYLWTYECELSYECMFSKNCYHCVFLDHCEGCNESYFSVDLKGCKNCMFCSNLRHKQYYILNKPYSKEEYFKKLSSYKLDSFMGMEKAKEFYFGKFRTLFPFRALYQVNCERSEGNNLENCKNIAHCHDCTDCEDIIYSEQIDATDSSMDMTCMGYDKGEVCYQTIGCTGTSFAIACDSCWHDHDIMYCTSCFSSHDCLGCISLRRKEYCILNEQYSQKDYEATRDKIIKEMKAYGEWGQFFPAAVSPFGYTETIADEHFPLTQETALARGWKWKQKDDSSYLPQDCEYPESILDMSDEICSKVLACTCCEKNYKIQQEELAFYRKLQVPIPRRCPDCRHVDRMGRRTPRKIFNHVCARCAAEITTTISPQSSETVFCVSCYLEQTD